MGNPEPANIQEFNARDVPQKIIETLNAVVQDHLEIEITSAEAKQEPDAQADRPGEMIILYELSYLTTTSLIYSLYQSYFFSFLLPFFL